MTRLPVKHCAGCRDDFYNGNNPLGVSECWSRKDAKLEARYELHVDAPMSGYKKPWRKVRKPNCYYRSLFVYISKLAWEKLR
jgi:hypothetical protein